MVAVVSLFTTSGSVLPSSYKVLTNASSGGTTGGWFVIPVRQWYRDCKGLFLYRSEVYVELGRHVKEKQIYIYVAHKSVTDNNIE